MNYRIGQPGIAWQNEEKQQWLAEQQIQRSYQRLVVDKFGQLNNHLSIHQYGELNYQAGDYGLYLLKSKEWQGDNKTVLITGGVHGYETSGVLGALRFAEQLLPNYQSQFNFIIVPCVSPWGFETINRWNPAAVDPNRAFRDQGQSPEANQLIDILATITTDIIAHFDLHETTDTDNTEFRPALAAREGTSHDNWNIPDGFYLVADTAKPQPEFQRAIIAQVEKVTHIAPADDNNQIIGAALEQHGVINYDAKPLGLCMSLTSAPFVTTTEVYPDSDLVDDENCIMAQVAAITGGLDYLASLN